MFKKVRGRFNVKLIKNPNNQKIYIIYTQIKFKSIGLPLSANFIKNNTFEI